jgi:hypothetical protein
LRIPWALCILLIFNELKHKPKEIQKMSLTKIINAALDSFKQNFKTICQNSKDMIDTLDHDNFKVMTSALMEASRCAGKAGLEEYLRQHDTTTPTIEKNGSVLRYKGTSSKELLTLFGTISANRAMYYDEKHGGAYHFPLDTALGIEKDDFATLETREMILFASASCVPQELSDLLKKCSLCTPSRTAVQNIMNRDGKHMETMRETLSEKTFKEQNIPEATDALVASLDGVNVLLRQPGKKKGRKSTRPIENDSRDSTTSYHNAMVGSVSFYTGDNDNKPDRIESIYTARMPQEKSTEFKADFLRMLTAVEEKIPHHKRGTIPKILLTDGHLMIKGFAKDSKRLHTYEKLLDFFHATEHLSKAAHAMYGENSDFSKAYFKKWREKLKTAHGAPNAIYRSLNGFQKRHNLSGKRAKDLETEITFFKKNKKLMKYYDFIQRGLPIGSGPIEAAAKTIVRQRMCRSGMSWSKEKGQYVLTIRAYVQSGLWDSVWENYKQLKKIA